MFQKIFHINRKINFQICRYFATWVKKSSRKLKVGDIIKGPYVPIVEKAKNKKEYQYLIERIGKYFQIANIEKETICAFGGMPYINGHADLREVKEQNGKYKPVDKGVQTTIYVGDYDLATTAIKELEEDEYIDYPGIKLSHKEIKRRRQNGTLGEPMFLKGNIIEELSVAQYEVLVDE